MIRVVRISGESIDLETGKELPKSLVLSNGLREISITVSDEIVQEVIRLQVEQAQFRSEQEVKGSGIVAGQVAGHTVGPPNPLSASAIEEAKRQIHERIQKVVRQPSVAAPGQPPPLATLDDAPEERDPDDPGQEYDDRITGAVSL